MLAYPVERSPAKCGGGVKRSPLTRSSRRCDPAPKLPPELPPDGVGTRGTGGRHSSSADEKCPKYRTRGDAVDVMGRARTVIKTAGVQAE